MGEEHWNDAGEEGKEEDNSKSAAYLWGAFATTVVDGYRVMSVKDFKKMAKKMQIDGDVRKWFKAGDETGDRMLNEEEFYSLYYSYIE